MTGNKDTILLPLSDLLMLKLSEVWLSTMTCEPDVCA